MSLQRFRERLKEEASVDVADSTKRFFKSDSLKGDLFMGVKTPVLRKIAKTFYTLSSEELSEMLHSPIHEERLGAIFVMTLQFQKGNPDEKRKIYDFYHEHISSMNNWDLVDSGAPAIVGAYLLDKDKTALMRLSQDENLWKRRIGIVSTLYFIRKGHIETTLEIAKNLLEDPEDLMHKATGWMLREVGKQSLADLEAFLQIFHKKMPRTMLRYAIERFPETVRKSYLFHAGAKEDLPLNLFP